MQRNHTQGGCTTEIRGLSVRFSGQEVLSGVDLTLHCGELTAVIGRNGVGKTTLLRSLMGILPHEGQVRFFSEAHLALKARIGYVPQTMHFDKLSPLRVSELFAACLSKRPVFLRVKPSVRAQALQSLSYTQAEHLADRRLGALSGGELQRVLLALALTPMPHILLLDEPVSGVDKNGLLIFYDLLDMLRREHDISILLVSHDVEISAKHADRMALLGDKTLLCTGSPEEVLSSQAYRDEFHIESGI